MFLPRVTLIGAGSVVFAAEIVRDVLASPGLPSGTFALVDIDEERLEVATAMTEWLVQQTGRDWRVESSTDRREMLRELMRLCERTAARLRAKSLVAGTVQLKIRQGDFTTFTRQQALRPPGNDTNTLFGIARRLLDGWLSDSPGSRVRLLGVGGSELAPAVQGDLFAPDENHHPLKGDATPQLDRAVDEIRGRFGDRSLNRARGLDPRQPR